jgi:hypothetical protein
MSKPEQLEILADHSIFRPTGQISLDAAVQLVTSAITFAREQHIRKLMVVTTGLTGFKPPDIVTRYFFIHEWARAAAARVCVAVVARPEMIDPQKFGIIVAANAGLISDVFESEEKALAWLQGFK